MRLYGLIQELETIMVYSQHWLMTRFYTSISEILEYF
jgi:hypothetical protein